MNNITIIGSGSFGCAISYILSKNNNVKIWSFKEEEKEYINNEHKCMFLPDLVLDEKVKYYTNYEEAIKDSNYIIIAVPSSFLRKTCIDIKPYIRTQEVILVSKGLENGNLLSEVIKEELNIIPSLISGPSHADRKSVV